MSATTPHVHFDEQQQQHENKNQEEHDQVEEKTPILQKESQQDRPPSSPKQSPASPAGSFRQQDNNNNNNLQRKNSNSFNKDHQQQQDHSSSSSKSRILSQKDNIRIGREEFDDAFNWITAKCHNGRVTERHLKEQLFSIFGQSPKWTRKEFALLASDPDLTADKLWSILPSKSSCESFDTVAEAFAGGFDEDFDGFVDTKLMKKMWKKIDEEYPASSSSASAAAVLGSSSVAAAAAAATSSSSKNKNKNSEGNQESSGATTTTTTTTTQQNTQDGTAGGGGGGGGDNNNTSHLPPQLQPPKDPFLDVFKMYLQIADLDVDGQVSLSDFREYSKKKKPPL